MNLTPDLLIRDLRVALRSLAHTKGLAIAVVLTLELGIGANAAIFSVVRGALLRPLVNRDENRLIYIRLSAPGIGIENTTFSVPEIQDLRAGVKTIHVPYKGSAPGMAKSFGPKRRLFTQAFCSKRRRVTAGERGETRPLRRGGLFGNAVA